MSSDLQLFNNSDLGSVRVVMRDNEPWFVGGRGGRRDERGKRKGDAFLHGGNYPKKRRRSQPRQQLEFTHF